MTGFPGTTDQNLPTKQGPLPVNNSSPLSSPMSNIIDLMSPSNDLPMSGVIEKGSREEERDGVSLTELDQLEIEGWRLIESPTGEESHEQQQQLDKATDAPGGRHSQIPSPSNSSSAARIETSARVSPSASLMKLMGDQGVKKTFFPGGIRRITLSTDPKGKRDSSFKSKGIAKGSGTTLPLTMDSLRDSWGTLSGNSGEGRSEDLETQTSQIALGVSIGMSSAG